MPAVSFSSPFLSLCSTTFPSFFPPAHPQVTQLIYECRDSSSPLPRCYIWFLWTLSSFDSMLVNCLLLYLTAHQPLLLTSLISPVKSRLNSGFLSFPATYQTLSSSLFCCHICVNSSKCQYPELWFFSQTCQLLIFLLGIFILVLTPFNSEV